MSSPPFQSYYLPIPRLMQKIDVFLGKMGKICLTKSKGGKHLSTFQKIALILTIIGAINWGLIGFLQFDLVASIFGGQTSALSRLVYSLVGLAGLINLGLLFKPTGRMEKQPEARLT